MDVRFSRRSQQVETIPDTQFPDDDGIDDELLSQMELPPEDVEPSRDVAPPAAARNEPWDLDQGSSQDLPTLKTA